MKSSSPSPPKSTSSQTSHSKTSTTDISNPQTSLESLDKNQRKWLWIYIIWLLGNIYTYLPTLRIGSPEFKEALFSFYFPLLILNIIVPLLAAAPYWIQLWGIIRKSFKATNIGIKIMYLYGFVWAVMVVIAWVGYFFHDKIEALMGHSQNAADRSGFYEAEDIPKLAKESVIGLANFVFGYSVSKKYKNYLEQRESLLKQKKE